MPAIARRQWNGSKRVCEKHVPPLGRLLVLAVERLNWPKEEKCGCPADLARG